MSEQALSPERRILIAMRHTLARIIRDLTPTDATKHYPLTDDTVEAIKQCFDLIAVRERELLQAAGVENRDRPHFKDEVRTSQVINLKPTQTKE